MGYQKEKKLVREYFDAMERAEASEIKNVMRKYMAGRFLQFQRCISISRTDKY